MSLQLLLNSAEGLAVEDRGMISLVGLAAIGDLADLDPIPEKIEQRPDAKIRRRPVSSWFSLRLRSSPSARNTIAKRLRAVWRGPRVLCPQA
jgi:hypothetical protein